MEQASVVKLMNRPRDGIGRPQTEALINFSDIMVRRIGGLLASQDLQERDRTTLARMDEVCGGRWRRQGYMGHADRGSGVAAVIDGYRRRLRDATRSGDRAVPVRRACDAAWLGISPGEVPDALLFDPEELLEEGWIRHIEANLAGLIGSGAAPFVIRDRYAAVMGFCLGEAREKHIRAAVKSLHAQSRTATGGRGDVATMVIRPAAQPPLGK